MSTGHDKGKVLLITGASSGIGAATAELAAQAGFRLVLAARDKNKLDVLAAKLGGDVLAVKCDVQSWESQQAMVKQALDHFGQIDVVFANAGRGSGPGGFSGADPEVWHDVVLTNVLGPALTLRASLEALKQQQGQVLITGSVAGRRSLPGSFYGITKWAMSGLAGNLREELKGSGVRVTLIEPGMVDTPFFDEAQKQALRPNDIARSVLFAIQQPAGCEIHDLCMLPTPPVD